MIGIINYGSGNTLAIADIYSKMHIKARLIDTPSQINECTKFILPGVGAFDHTIKALADSGMLSELNEHVIRHKKPILGICVGMQIMTKRSDEGTSAGLGWVDAETKRFDPSKISVKPKLPHLGWNSIQASTRCPLFEGIDFNRGFYFLHSYYVDCVNTSIVAATTMYGQSFTCAFAEENIFGCQFHPEKSHLNGVRIFRNFAEL